MRVVDVRTDVGRHRDHLAQLAAAIQDRTAQGFQPDHGAVDSAPLQGACNHLALAQVLPEALVILGLDIERVTQHAVMLAHHFMSLVAQHAEEFVIGIEDAAIGSEFENGHGTPERAQQRLAFLLAQALVIPLRLRGMIELAHE